jgi:hypothetical protein
MINDIYDFINDPDKKRSLISVNNILNIDKSKKLVFIYTLPKVGSTSLVSSLRLFASKILTVLHIHDEIMLKVLTHIDNISIKEIILYNKYLGKEVYVINVFRSPIERKISSFFEKISTYHFNNNETEVNTYNINKIIVRFNNIFPWIGGNGDNLIDNYGINIPEHFDYVNKYLLLKENDITYISLRLCDSAEWGKILTNIFKIQIHVIRDYESSKKTISDLYCRFKLTYRIPINLLNDIIKDKYFCYYYSPDELTNYYNEWVSKSMEEKPSYTLEQYNLYNQISIENMHLDIIQTEHYFDEGCVCKACFMKRKKVIRKILNDPNSINESDKIVHSGAKSELIENKIIKASKLNAIIADATTNGKKFKNNMTSIVYKKK